jgi:hypothetical protein
MSTPSHPSSLSSSSASPVPISRISEGKEEDEVVDEVDQDDEDGESTVSESPQSQQLQAQLEIKEDENAELRRQLAFFSARYKDDEKEERKRVIDQRVSLSAKRDVRGVTIVNEALPSQRSSIGSSPLRSPVAVPHRQGRLTLSPPILNSPIPKVKTSPTQKPSHSNPDLTADHGEDEEKEITEKQREGLVKSMGSPKKFTGDKSLDKQPDVRDWVDETEKWLATHLGEGVTKGLLVFVSGLLEGGAGLWLDDQVALLKADLKAMGMKARVEWYEVREAFIEQFEGPQYRVLIREDLKNLRLWKGKCKTIPLFNSEFDRLSRRLYPSGQDLAVLVPVLAEDYGNCLRNSDEDLWLRCVAFTIPTSVHEWRERAVSCYATREILKAQKGTWAASPSSKSASSSLAQFSTEGETEEGQTNPSQSLNAFQQRPQGQASKPQEGQGKGKVGYRSGGFLTEDEFRTLWRLGKCFFCFLRGHKSADCPKKNEPRRHPTAEELKQ